MYLKFGTSPFTHFSFSQNALELASVALFEYRTYISLISYLKSFLINFLYLRPEAY